MRGIGVFAFCLLAAAAAGDPVAKLFPHPDRIRYDGRCLTIDGRDRFIVAEEIDFSAVPPSGWPERFRRLKASGCNAVEGKWGRGQAGWGRAAADEFGLYAIVRPVGPLAGVCRAVAPFQVSRRRPGTGGVILLEISGADLGSGYDQAMAAGIDIPLFSVGRPECRDSSDPKLGQVFDALDDRPGLDLGSELPALEAAQPDAPAMVLGLPPNRVLAAISGGATLLCLRPTPDDPLLAAIGRMIRNHGPDFARSRVLACQAETGNSAVTISARRAQGGATYLFFQNDEPSVAARGSAVIWLEHAGETRIVYELPPGGERIFRFPPKEIDPKTGNWLP